MITEAEETIPIRMCNELVYCPRLFHIEHVQGIFVESAETVEGSGQHERAARRGKVRRKPGTAAADNPEQPASDVPPWDALIPRSMEWSAPAWGVHGRLDMVELSGDEVVAVEAKRGSAPAADRHHWQDFELPHRAWPPDVAQLGLYMAVLRDAGLPCSEGRLFYRGNGIHTVITWSDELERFLRAVVAEAMRVRSLAVAPEPLESSPKCVGCSLHGVCLPDEHHALKAEAAARELHPIRRILPGRDDRAVVHVTRPGTLVRKESESLVICPRDGEPERLLLKDISHVALYGPVQVTEQCMQLLLMQGVPVSHHTSAGRLLGLSAPMLSQNIHLRRAQFRAADDPARSLEAARALVLAKIRNQRTVLRRYSRGVEQTLSDEQGDLPDWAGADDKVPGLPPPADDQDKDDDDHGEAVGDDPEFPEPGPSRGPASLTDPRIRCVKALRAMQQALRRAGQAGDLDVLRGCEGEAAAYYFAALPAILPAAWQQDFVGRSRRPPRDRVNALLSFGYALLTRDATAAAARVGLDPMLGFLHTVVPGRPALALDLIEPFRAAWVDTAVLRLLATRGIDRDDFVFTSAGVSLTSSATTSPIRPACAASTRPSATSATASSSACSLASSPTATARSWSPSCSTSSTSVRTRSSSSSSDSSQSSMTSRRAARSSAANSTPARSGSSSTDPQRPGPVPGGSCECKRESGYGPMTPYFSRELKMTLKPPRETPQEIRRDEQLVSCDLLRNLGRLLLDAMDTLLLGGPALDVQHLHTKVAQILTASGDHLRRLNDARINRRGEIRTRTLDTATTPEAAQPYLRNGVYVGSYTSLQTLAADALALDALANPELARLDLTGVGLDLHLHGILWTVMIDGSLHAFRPHPQE